MSAKWEGIDMGLVKDDWRKDLASCSISQIAFAVEYSRKEQHPPSIGTFLEICKRYSPEQKLALQRKFTESEMQLNRERAKSLSSQLSKTVGDKDWAKKILNRVESGDKTVVMIAEKFAKEALNIDFEGVRA